MRHMGPRRRASTPSGARSARDSRWRPLNRCEIFDETDLDAALARFDELQPQAPRLENAASRVEQGSWRDFAARNRRDSLRSSPMKFHRRSPSDSGGRSRDGRDAVIAEMPAMADGRRHEHNVAIVATRGERLALTRIATPRPRPRAERFHVEVLDVVEIDAEERVVAHVEFDPNDLGAAFEELDGRYLAGEAADRANNGRPLRGPSRAQPTRNARDDGGLGERRPSSANNGRTW